MRGWRNTLEIVLFEISSSMKLYPSVFQEYTNTLRPVTSFLSQNISMRFPTVCRQPLARASTEIVSTTEGCGSLVESTEIVARVHRDCPRGEVERGAGLWSPIGHSPFGSRSPKGHQSVTKNSLVILVPMFILTLRFDPRSLKGSSSGGSQCVRWNIELLT